jgi:ankyrin repeat protein
MKHKPHSRFDPTHAYRQAAAAASIVGKPDVFEAAQSGNIKLVKDHVMADAGCLLKADSRYDCLFLALALPQPMQFGSIFLISVISGWTALMHSSSRGHLDVTRFLVESGANLEAKSKRYYNP